VWHFGKGFDVLALHTEALRTIVWHCITNRWHYIS